MDIEELTRFWLEGYHEIAITHGLTTEKLEAGMEELGYAMPEIVRQQDILTDELSNFK